MLGEGVVIKDEFSISVDGERLEGVGRINILIILFREELIVGVVGIGQEALHPIKVILIGDQSIMIFIDSGEDFFKDGIFEVV